MPLPANKDRLPTGCRADTIMGVWLYEDQHFDMLFDAAWGVVSRGELEQCSGRSREMIENRPLYEVKDGIARFSMSGPLTKHPTSFTSMFGGTAMMTVRQALSDIRNDHQIKGVFIDADSWGGTAEGVEAAAEAVRKTALTIPVVFHAEDKATSAMLWPATQGVRFTAGPMASIGSMGCKLVLQRNQEAEGKPLVFKTGRYKNFFMEGEKMTKEAAQEIQNWVDAQFQPFKDQVVKARGLSPSQAEDAATARIFVGPAAVGAGLIDAVCSTDEAYDSLKELIASGAAVRGPAPVRKQPAAPIRSHAMALNATQIQQARQEIPGAANVPEQELEGFVLGYAVSTKQVAASSAGQLSTLQQAIAAKDTEIATLKSQAPKRMDQGLLKGHADLSKRELALRVAQGQMLQSQADLFTGAVLAADGNVTPLGEVLLTPVGTEAPIQSVMKAFELNKPNGLTTVQSGAQPAPKTEPGKPEAEGAVTYEKYVSMCQQRTIKPVPRAEWEQRHVA